MNEALERYFIKQHDFLIWFSTKYKQECDKYYSEFLKYYKEGD